MGILVLVDTWVHLPHHLQYVDLLLGKNTAIKTDHPVELPCHNNIDV